MNRSISDEAYVIDLCDQVLGLKASRQHRFDFLLGDLGKNGLQASLPVDAYYEEFGLVIEYWERQHLFPTPIMDRRMTCSGCTRGEQRKIYDQRKRELLECRGHKLLVLKFEQFEHDRRGRLKRNATSDSPVLKSALLEQLPNCIFSSPRENGRVPDEKSEV